MIKWDKKRVERLRKMVLDGIPYSQIGENLGCNKNAVCGAVSRYIRVAGTPVERKPVARKIPVGKTKPYTTSFPKRRGGHRNASVARVQRVESIPLAEGPGTHLLDLSHFQCRYPLEGRWMFCGSPQTQGSYCADHAALCYRPERPARTEGFRIPAWRVAA